MPVFDSDGIEIEYEQVGEGAPVVLVHGFAADRNLNWKLPGWYEIINNARRSVVAIDCRGHGNSDKPHDCASYDLDKMAGDVLRLCQHLDLEKPDLMGYSMGAMISTHLLINHGQHFNPVLVVVGEKDDLVGGGENLTGAISGATLVTLPGRNHINAVGDKLYQQSVVEFLAEHSPVQ